MAYACDVCGKGKQFGHNVPFSQKKTNKVWKPNLQKKYLVVDGTRVQVKICTQCLRTLAKYEREAAAKKEAQVLKEASKSPETTPKIKAAAKPAAKKAPAKKPTKAAAKA
jgi:large subunit ribosomal protein L28